MSVGSYIYISHGMRYSLIFVQGGFEGGGGGLAFNQFHLNPFFTEVFHLQVIQIMFNYLYEIYAFIYFMSKGL